MEATTSKYFSTLLSSLKQTIVQHKNEINQPEFQIKRRTLLNIEKALSKQVDCFCFMLHPQLSQIELNREEQERLAKIEEQREKEFQRQQKQNELSQRQRESTKQAVRGPTDDSEGINNIEQSNKETINISLTTGKKVKAARKSAPTKKHIHSSSFDENEDKIYLDDTNSVKNSTDKLEDFDVDGDYADEDDTEQIKRLIEKYQKEGIQMKKQDSVGEDEKEEQEDKKQKYDKQNQQRMVSQQLTESELILNNDNENQHIETSHISLLDSAVKDQVEDKDHQVKEVEQYQEELNIQEKQQQAQSQIHQMESKGKSSKQSISSSKLKSKNKQNEEQDNCSTQPVSENKSQSENLNELSHLEVSSFDNNNAKSEGIVLHSLDNQQQDSMFFVESNEDSQETNNQKQEFSHENITCVNE